MGQAINAQPNRASAYTMLALASLVALGAAFAVGYLPTRNVAGDAGIESMLIGLAISFAAALGGLIPQVAALHRPPLERQTAVMMGMAVRFIATLFLTLAAIFGGAPHRGSLVVWIAVSYLLLLAVDTCGVVWLFKRTEKPA